MNDIANAASPNQSVYARPRSTVTTAVQTESSFAPSMIDLKYTYEPSACDQFTQLLQMRAMIQRCMQEVAGSVYDVVNFKDVMFKMEEEFPTSLPVTDMLLLCSKLFRSTSEMSRLLGCFFGVVFADEHADEHFHFSEIRILQRELKEVKAQLKHANEERSRLQQMLDNVGQVALDHGKAVELLENHNHALQLQTTALEDQMALLFRQLNSDLEVNCKEAYEKVSAEMETQERLNPTRTTFRQTMDSLSQQIRSSRSLITEVREALLACSQGSRTGDAYVAVEPSVRFKLKMLDSSYQQLVGRFTAVKDTVVETAQELMTALHERKRILYLSYQHIRLYDLQNAKLRAGKAVLSELRNYTNDLLQRMQATFPSGAITSVDRIGRITTQRWHGGYTLAALRQRKAAAAAGDGAAKDGSSGNPGTNGILPGLTEAEVMAAESELAAFEEANDYGGTNIDYERFTGQPGIAAPSEVAPAQQRAGFADEERIELPRGSYDGAGTYSSLRPSSQRGRPSSSAATPGLGSNRATILTDAPATLFEEASKGNTPPFTNVYDLLELAKLLDADIVKLNEALTLEDEMSAFLKTLTLSVTSTGRSDISPDGSLFPPTSGASTLEKMEGDFERALMPTGGLTSYRQRNSINSLMEREKDRAAESEECPSPTSSAHESGSKRLKGRSSSASSKREKSSGEQSGATLKEQAHAEALLARQAQQLQRKQEQLSKMQDDFSSKLGFLRQVYEARITDLEVKESTLKKRFNSSATPAPASVPAVPNASTPTSQGASDGINVSPTENAFNLGTPQTNDATSVASGGQVTPRPGVPPHPGSGKKRTKGRYSSAGPKDAEFAMVRDVNAVRGNDDEIAQLRAKTDREELLATRGEWRKAKQTVQANRKMREVTASEIDHIEQKTEAKKARKRTDMFPRER